MILVLGEVGSGKTNALRAFESAPPAGVRAVYVPVPTLDFTGLATWCLDRLGEAPGEDAPAGLRAVCKRGRIALLIDDADRLPLEAALALRQLERDAAGGLGLVAATSTDQRESSPLVALGAPARTIEVAGGRGQEAAATLRALFTAGPSANAAAPARGARPLSTKWTPLPPPAPRAAPLESVPARSEPAPIAARLTPSAQPPAAMPAAEPAFIASRSARSVPLSLAIAMACAAFLLPVAFGVGYVLGGTQGTAGGAPTVAEAPTPPPVSSAPPEAAPSAASQAAPLAQAPSEMAPPTRAPVPAVASEPVSTSPEERAPPPARRAARAAPTPASQSAAPEPAASREEPTPDAREWGAPALISVEPGSGGP
jgi:hypothetical protein